MSLCNTYYGTMRTLPTYMIHERLQPGKVVINRSSEALNHSCFYSQRIY